MRPQLLRPIKSCENGFVFGFIIRRRELESNGKFDGVPFGGLKDHSNPSDMVVG